MHKGRNRGLAQNGNTVAFGRFGLVASDRGRITAVIRPLSDATKPNLPKATVFPFCARPLFRPLCIFLNFVCFGCNIFN